MRTIPQAVLQDDIHQYLNIFADKSYDYIVLSQTLQVLRRPQAVLRELLRVGKKIIVSFPNFAYWSSRLQLLLKGKAPVWKALPSDWFDKPEETINYMSIADFEIFVRDRLGARLVQSIFLSSRLGRRIKMMPNLLADEAIFVIEKINE